MSESNMHEYDFGNDPEFQEKFYKNIDKVLSDINFDLNEDIVKIEPTKDRETAIYNDIEDKASETAAVMENDEVLEAVSVTEGEESSEASVMSQDDEVAEAEAMVEDDEAAKAETIAQDDEAAEAEAMAEDDEAAQESETASMAEDDVLSETSVMTEDDETIEAAAIAETAASEALIDSSDTLEETIFDINNSLAKQIGEELENMEEITLKKKKRARMMKIQMGLVAGLLSLLGIAFFLGFTKPGNELLIRMGVNLGGKIWGIMTQDFDDEPVMADDIDYVDEEDIASDSEEIDPDEIEWPNSTGYGRREEGVYNILLLGEEAIGSGTARGRTDLMIIATLNKNSKSIKLTSLMRDTLVQIPGYKENKLNSAYEKGDVNLLYETIALNFNLHIDGCVLVNFENFEKIIDYMGGLELTLTKAEAKYLRNTNYISNPKYRTVVEGTQLMNGNQVLGYSRIRKRAAITGANNDYGRTDRHRIILEAIFDKYKTKNEAELLMIMYKMLPLVKTDIDSKTFEKMLTTFIEMRTMEIEQLRIPADGTFKDNVKVRGMDVLIPDLSKNISILHEFIFED